MGFNSMGFAGLSWAFQAPTPMYSVGGPDVTWNAGL